MNKKFQLTESVVNESWVHQPNTLYIHRLVSTNSAVDQRLQYLYDKGVISSPEAKDVYMYSFLHPDMEFAFSVFKSGPPKKGVREKVFTSYFDPQRIILNKRMLTNGFSLEKISERSFETTFFMATGRAVRFKKVLEVPSDTISTNIFGVGTSLTFGLFDVNFSKFKMTLETPNKLNANQLMVSKVDMLSPIVQLFTKSNYLFVYNMRLT